MAAPSSVKVWDLWLRLFHWGLVAAFATAWFSADEWSSLHHWAGYTVAGLLAWRCLWGIVGPPSARFTSFVRSPAAAVAHLRDMLSGKEKRHLGHNPAGAAMIIALLLSLAVLACSGWLSTTDRFWGVDWVQEVHELAGDLVLVLVGLHLVGVIASSWLTRENLVRAMITGRKRAASGDDKA
ncbi:Cytochrome b [Onishia taeanensis]|jgi:cytochrome b|uniref:Cytochrome b n=1 Tax=Onishia taeanensis TaxID=284577 RepID=A0A1G7SSB6_9GAMM|nr:cytochrome b/b6 domain-containing protein [Halomonas taeanensis]MAX32889.1 cytochrome B [Halomonadaceae bacterium]SDG25170.1 Cytochrome b [Halomonas taeanensis]